MIAWAKRFACEASDSDDTRSEKTSIFLVAVACCFFSVVWSGVYYWLFGAGLTAALPLVFAAIVGPALVVSHFRRNHRIAVYAQILCITYVTTFVQLSIGGAFDSGFVMAWALLGPLIALMFFPVRQAIVWMALFLVNVVVVAVFDDVFSAHGERVSEGQRLVFFVMNLGIASSVVFAFAAYFVRTALNEKQKADRLLLNILPEKTARMLKSREGVIAEEFESVTVLFADIVNFTAYSSGKKPAEVVSKLNEIFHRFDQLADRHGLEKIKTIGDAYMVVGGLPEPNERHCHAIAAMAIEMMETIRTVDYGEGGSFTLRIGIHTGPVVAGVIGIRKFAYDLWGDTVNVASRLESNGVPGRIQVSDEVARRLRGAFVLERRGAIMLKGKGMVDAHFLVGAA